MIAWGIAFVLICLLPAHFFKWNAYQIMVVSSLIAIWLILDDIHTLLKVIKERDEV